MKCKNRVELIGRVGKDPEIRSTGSGKRVANFSLATSWGTGDKEVTQWHNCVAWEKVADIIENYVKKGDALTVEGELTYRKWEKDGVKHTQAEIVVKDIWLQGGKDAQRQPASQGAAKKEPTYDDFPADFPDDSDLPFS